MNRADRLRDILMDGEPHCSRELSRELGTGAFRAACELKKRLTDGLRLERVDSHTHQNQYGQPQVYAVYQLTREPSGIVQELRALKEQGLEKAGAVVPATPQQAFL